MKWGRYITVVKICICLGFWNFFCIDKVYSQTAKNVAGAERYLQIQTKFSKHFFLVEIARTAKEQSFGLMFRNKLLPNSGMLFLYSKIKFVKMWMKNTFIPLDILFISSEGKIVKIVERAIPGSRQIISSGQPIKAVLEIKGGTVARFKLSLGDLVKHSFFNNL